MRHFAPLFALGGLLLGLTAVVPALAQTTKNTKQDTPDYGGISEAEEKALDAKTQQMLRKFKDGRADSDSGASNTRWTNILELHDHEKRGVSSHGVGNGVGSKLEIGMEKAAGLQEGLSGAEREKAIREKVCPPEDKRPKITTKIKGKMVTRPKPCNDISPNIVDAGAAHADADSNPDFEEHRIYKLNQEAQQKALEVGNEYAGATVDAAKNYNYEGRLTKGIDGGKRVLIKDTGQIKDVNANIDLLHSESAFLEKQIDKNIESHWKSLRAKRLADSYKSRAGYGDSGGSAAMGELIDGGASDQQVVQRIADERAVGYKSACMDASGKIKILGPDDTCDTTGDKNKRGSIKELLNDPRAQEGDNNADELFKQAKESMGEDERKRAQEEMPKIAQCLQRDAWCDPSTLEVKTDDPGNYFSDTRELMYIQLQKARQGGLNNFEQTMSGNADFNAQTNPEEWRAMQQQVQDAQRAYQEMKANDKTGQFADRDASSQNAAQLSRIDPNGGSMLYRVNRDPAQGGAAVQNNGVPPQNTGAYEAASPEGGLPLQNPQAPLNY